MNARLALFSFLGILGWTALPAQDAPSAPEDPAHAELRAVRQEVVAAIQKGDLDATLRHVHPNVVVTWQNNEVCRGHDGLRKFFEKMEGNPFQEYRVEPEADELSILYGGDTAVAFGRSVGLYRLLGQEFEFHNRWTATAVKEDGRWLLAAYHVSLNALDNPILGTAKKGFAWAAPSGLLAGLVLGFLLFRRRRAAA